MYSPRIYYVADTGQMCCVKVELQEGGRSDYAIVKIPRSLRELQLASGGGLAARHGQSEQTRQSRNVRTSVSGFLASVCEFL